MVMSLSSAAFFSDSVDGTVSLPGIAPGTGCTGLLASAGWAADCGGLALGPGSGPRGPVSRGASCAEAAMLPTSASMIAVLRKRFVRMGLLLRVTRATVSDAPLR